MSKSDAYAALAKEIEKNTGGSSAARPDGNITFQNFGETRWWPLREARLRPSSKASALHTLSHVYAKFGTTPLERLNKVELQTWLNELAKSYSKSLVPTCQVLSQEYLIRGPGAGLHSEESSHQAGESPRTKQTANNDVLTPEQFRAVIAELKCPYDLMVRLGPGYVRLVLYTLCLLVETISRPRRDTLASERTMLSCYSAGLDKF